MIIADDVSLHFQFPVGKKYVIVRIDFKHGDDSEDVLRAFFVQEDIPVYLEMPILATVDRLLKDPAVLAKERSKIINLDVMQEQCKALSTCYNSTWRIFSSNTQSKLSLNPTISKTESENFEQAFHFICNKSIEDCDRVVQFQEKQQKVVNKLISQRKEESDSMHANQSDEMNKATVSDQNNISVLVEKHMTELEELDRKYREKLYSLNARQTASFKEFIQKYNSIDHSTETLEPEQEEDPGDQKWHRRWFKLRDHNPDQSDDDNSLETKKVNRIMGFDASLTVSLGNSNPVLYNLELNTASATDIIKVTQKNRKSLIKASRSLFSNNLTGLVVMGDPSLSYKGRTEAALLELSETSTDPIFESLTSQISRTQAETIGSDKKLEIGDFFITKHSNLGEYHVLFHYMGEDTRSPSFVAQSLPIPSDSALLEGLRNIFEIVFQYDITSITLPLLLCEDLPDHLRTHAFCLTRALAVMRALRSILLTSSDNTLKTVRLLLPSMSIEVFEKYKAALKNVFSKI